MSGNRSHFVSLDLLIVRLGLTDSKWAKKTVRRLIDDGVIESVDFWVEPSPKKGRGRPSITYFLSHVGSLALAMHTQTEEAAKWRRAQVDRLATVPTNALPAAPASHDSAVWAALEQMRRDITVLAVRQGEVEQRVERRRPMRQLALPMMESDRYAAVRALIQVQPHGAEVRLCDLALAAGLDEGAGTKKALGILLGRLGWQAVKRERRNGTRTRVYRNVAQKGVH
jgi:hypothetical protein